MHARHEIKPIQLNGIMQFSHSFSLNGYVEHGKNVKYQCTFTCESKVKK